VNPHLETIPGLRTLTARSLTSGDFENLCGEANGALNAEGLGLGALDQVGGDFLQSLNLATGQGDADTVDLGTFPELALLWLVVRHGCRSDEKIAAGISTVEGRMACVEVEVTIAA